uniref:Telomerase Cajal body protein 1 n=1 Tax=Chenopodium quinoa TaxID=63459 RepID=A0A803LPM0_CHEQI
MAEEQPQQKDEHFEENGAQQENDETMVNQSEVYSWPEIRFDIQPHRNYHFHRQFRSPSNPNNFLKSAKWSPDGSCFLTSSDDNTLRLFSLPDNESDYPDGSFSSDPDEDSYAAKLVIYEGESVYDYCWYPYMSASDMTSCVFATTTRDHPIHLWDSTTGELRCTYRAFDAMDEITAAFSVAFNPTGTKIFAGYNKTLRVFDVHRPGKDFKQHSTLQGSKEGQSGIISAIAFSPANSGMFATGSYDQTTAIYSEDNMELLLYRSTEHTNQRISFDIEPIGRHLGTGGQDGLVHIYDLQTGQWASSFAAASDTVNGFSFHPFLPMAVTSSGHRRFGLPDDADDAEIVTINSNSSNPVAVDALSFLLL